MPMFDPLTSLREKLARDIVEAVWAQAHASYLSVGHRRSKAADAVLALLPALASALPSEPPAVPTCATCLAAMGAPAYLKDFGDERPCTCGHEYYRHFDTYEDMAPVGCKYCECRTFVEPAGAPAAQPFAEHAIREARKTFGMEPTVPAAEPPVCAEWSRTRRTCGEMAAGIRRQEALEREIVRLGGTVEPYGTVPCPSCATLREERAQAFADYGQAVADLEAAERALAEARAQVQAAFRAGMRATRIEGPLAGPAAPRWTFEEWDGSEQARAILAKDEQEAYANWLATPPSLTGDSQ